MSLFVFFERGGLFFLGLMEERDSNLFLPRVEVGPFLLGGLRGSLHTSTGFFSSSSGTRIIYKTALSSYTSSSNPLVFVEEVLVTGHEIGHCWGSYHDPACSNVFIMNQYALDGSQPTHKVGPKTSIGIEFKWGGEGGGREGGQQVNT